MSKQPSRSASLQENAQSGQADNITPIGQFRAVLSRPQASLTGKRPLPLFSTPHFHPLPRKRRARDPLSSKIAKAFSKALHAREMYLGRPLTDAENTALFAAVSSQCGPPPPHAPAPSSPDASCSPSCGHTSNRAEIEVLTGLVSRLRQELASLKDKSFVLKYAEKIYAESVLAKGFLSVNPINGQSSHPLLNNSSAAPQPISQALFDALCDVHFEVSGSLPHATIIKKGETVAVPLFAWPIPDHFLSRHYTIHFSLPSVSQWNFPAPEGPPESEMCSRSFKPESREDMRQLRHVVNDINHLVTTYENVRTRPLSSFRHLPHLRLTSRSMALNFFGAHDFPDTLSPNPIERIILSVRSGLASRNPDVIKQLPFTECKPLQPIRWSTLLGHPPPSFPVWDVHSTNSFLSYAGCTPLDWLMIPAVNQSYTERLAAVERILANVHKAVLIPIAQACFDHDQLPHLTNKAREAPVLAHLQ